MSTQTFEKPTERIVESLTAAAKVDPENGIVRNVKLIGFESKNGRIYPPQVLKSAVHLYEGAKVNIDHPAGGDPAKPRSYQDRFGVIRNVRFVEGSGLHGDFHYNPKHPAAEQFTWDAEHNPELVGFSHNALLRVGQVKNGRTMIEEIVSIRSMDLVADPATTISLFESENGSMEMSAPTAPVIDAPTQDKPNPQEQIKNALKQMVLAAIDDDKLDMKATIKKIQEIMKAQEKLMGGMTGGSDSSDGQEHVEPTAVGGGDPTLHQQIALLKQQLEQFQGKERLAQLQESINSQLAAAGLDPQNKSHVSELFAKQLLATESEQDRAALIQDRAALVGTSMPAPQPQGAGTPVYKPATPGLEQIDAKAFASRLLS